MLVIDECDRSDESAIAQLQQFHFIMVQSAQKQAGDRLILVRDEG